MNRKRFFLVFLLGNISTLSFAMNTIGSSSAPRSSVSSSLRSNLLSLISYPDFYWPAEVSQCKFKATDSLPENNGISIQNCLNRVVHISYASQPDRQAQQQDFLHVDGAAMVHSGEVFEFPNYVPFEQQTVHVPPCSGLDEKTFTPHYFYVGHVLVKIDDASARSMLLKQIIAAYGKWMLIQHGEQIALVKGT